MGEFEIRILDKTGATKLVREEFHLSADAAIRSARKEANGMPFEVWSGIIRIYPAEQPPPAR